MSMSKRNRPVEVDAIDRPSWYGRLVVQGQATPEAERDKDNPCDLGVYSRKRGYIAQGHEQEQIELRCRCCANVFPATSRYFPVDGRYRLGVENICRDCRAGYMRDWRKKKAA